MNRTDVRFELQSPQQLAELAAAVLPADLRADAPRRSLHRDLYLDTPDDALRRRGIVCRLRIQADDQRILSLHIGGGPTAPPMRVSARVRGVEAVDAVRENSAPGRRLRALVDPALLQVRVSLEVERLTRRAARDWLGRHRVELHYDQITVRRDTLARTFQQLCVHRVRGNGDDVERLAGYLAATWGLHAAAGNVRDRAEVLLKWLRVEPFDHGLGSDRIHRVPVPLDGERVAEFINPELSLLAFQSRVLSLAEDPATPLRERLRFLSIVSANLDEFFMVRMAGLRMAAVEQREEQSDDGLMPSEQLDLIKEAVADLVGRQARCAAHCLGALEAHGVRLRTWRDLDDAQRAELRDYFRENVFPTLTPLAMTVAPGHPLPRLAHLSLSMALVLRGQDGRPAHFAELELPPTLPRFLAIDGDDGSLITIEEVVRGNLDVLYPHEHVEHAFLFRITRGGDLDLDERAADSLLDAVADATARRAFNAAVRIELERGTPALLRDLVLEDLRRERAAAGEEEMPLRADDVQIVDGLLDLRCLGELPMPADPVLEYPSLIARDPVRPGVSMFDAIRQGELVVHHPFESFARTVVRFLQEAAADPDVTAIKITLYRVGDPSPVVEALLDAAKSGKEVAAFVELKARFDEDWNVRWARALEQAGGRVVYGLVGLKNHAKVALVVRREDGKLRRYVHVGTGNYNARSGRQYTDLSLFSASEALVGDVSELFNELTGSSAPPRRLSRGALIAPHQLMPAMLERIEREAEHARAGLPARIDAKFNGLSDPDIVRALYRASQAGVDIRLAVRGICTLRPAVPGRSDRIRVVSIVGRFLEHSRIYRFANGGDPEYFIGSSDWRPRNLRRRVELLVPVRDPANRLLLDHILETYLENGAAWELTSAGEYVKRAAGTSGAQERLASEISSRASPAAAVAAETALG
jgi:polyphosphate kinase